MIFVIFGDELNLPPKQWTNGKPKFRSFLSETTTLGVQADYSLNDFSENTILLLGE